MIDFTNLDDPRVQAFMDAKHRGYLDGKGDNKPNPPAGDPDLYDAYVKGYGEGHDEAAFMYARKYRWLGENPLDARHTDIDDEELIGDLVPEGQTVKVVYSRDVFLLWDAIAKLANCRYVLVNRRGLIVDTNMLCDGDVIVFDRKKYQQMIGFE